MTGDDETTLVVYNILCKVPPYDIIVKYCVVVAVIAKNKEGIATWILQIRKQLRIS
jgi:hypothetical protein